MNAFAMAPLHSGSVTPKNVRIGLAPSVVAASPSESEMLAMMVTVLKAMKGISFQA